jgi:hypothetical protein
VRRDAAINRTEGHAAIAPPSAASNSPPSEEVAQMAHTLAVKAGNRLLRQDAYPSMTDLQIFNKAGIVRLGHRGNRVVRREQVRKLPQSSN